MGQSQPKSSAAASGPRPWREDAKVLVEEHIGVGDDVASRYLPRAVHLVQHVGATTGEELLIRLQVRPAAVPLCRFPRIDQSKGAAREIADITGRELCAGNSSRRGDLRIEGLDRPALTTARGDDLGVMDGRLFVERQHPAREIVGEHRLGRSGERGAP